MIYTPGTGQAYPVTSGMSTGLLSNTTSNTYYIYGVFNSGGVSSGYATSDNIVINGTTTLTIPSGVLITSAGQYIYTAYSNYFIIPPYTTNVSVTLNKGDGLGTGSTLRLGYTNLPGNPITNL